MRTSILYRTSLCLHSFSADAFATTNPRPPPLHSRSPPRASTTQRTFINVHALIIVRHADIDIATKKTMADRAPLIARGEARAKELAYALKDAGINRIITSVTLRTQETAAILAADKHITPETPFAHGHMQANITPAYLDAKKKEAATVFEYLVQTGEPNDVVLLVHHHSVIPGLLDLLGAKGEAPFVEDAEFDRVYVILPDASTSTYRILRLRYGGKWSTP